MKKKILVFIVLLIISITGVYKSIQNDTFYSIKIGEDILNYGIDMIDHYSFHDLTYTYPHWLYDVIISKIYHTFGYIGLYITNIIVLLTSSLCVYYFLHKQTKNNSLSLLFAGIMCYLIGPNVTTRAQSLSYLILILELINIEKFLEKGRIKNLVFIYFLLVLLFNTHMALYPVYFILFLPYIAEYLISNIVRTCPKIFNKRTINMDNFIFEENKNIKKLILFIPLLLTAGLLTPVGLNAYTYVFKNLSGYSVNFIVEHKPAVIMDLPEFYLSLIILFLSLIVLRLKIRLRDLFFLCGFIIMSLQATRNVTLFYIFFSILFGRTIIEYFKNKKLPILIFVLLMIFPIYRYNTIKNYDYVGKEYPKGAIKYIKKNLDIDNIRIYNEYDIGSYLLFNDIKVFVDSRSDLYEVNFNKMKRPILEDTYLYSDTYNEVLDYYDISHVLLYKSRDIVNTLKNDKNYKELYQDDIFILYERKMK